MENSLIENTLAFAGVCVLALSAQSDIRRRLIPVYLPLLFGIFSVCVRGFDDAFRDALLGSIPGILIILLHWISQKQIGIGDGIMMTGMGFYLGIHRGLLVLFLSLGILFMFSCVGLSLRKIHRKTCLPYAPFYLAAYIGVVVL